MDSTTTLKTCTRCNQAKPLSEYYPRRNSKIGYAPRCKQCESRRHKDKNLTANFPIAVAEKLCPKCQTVKSANEFSRHRGFTTGLASHCRSCLNAASKVWLRELKTQTIEAYGGSCVCCGETQYEFLAIDHVDGGGKQHRASLPGGSGKVYLDLRRRGFPKDGFRLLCHNCNLSFGVYGYCPHQKASREAA